MSGPAPTLHLLCGKIAAGKSTLAAELSKHPETVLLAEDRWLAALYPGGIHDLEDYVRCSGRLRDVIGEHVEALLRAGLSVVLDFPANRLDSRRWMMGIIERAGARHVLHVLEVPDAVCKERLRLRNLAGDHAFQASEADFDLFTRYFQPPTEAEGFDIEVHRP
jgi:predicted kinase